MQEELNSEKMYCYFCRKEINPENWGEYKTSFEGNEENIRVNCKECYNNGKRLPKKDDELRIDSLLWVYLKCCYCLKKYSLREFHFQYNMMTHKLLANCPNCKKTNNVKIELGELDENKNGIN
jgi:hypothetical protein